MAIYTAIRRSDGHPSVNSDATGLTVDVAGIAAPDAHASVIVIDVDGEMTPIVEAKH